MQLVNYGHRTLRHLVAHKSLAIVPTSLSHSFRHKVSFCVYVTHVTLKFLFGFDMILEITDHVRLRYTIHVQTYKRS